MKSEWRKQVKGDFLFWLYNTEKTGFLVISGVYSLFNERGEFMGEELTSKDTIGENALFDHTY